MASRTSSTCCVCVADRGVRGGGNGGGGRQAGSLVCGSQAVLAPEVGTKGLRSQEATGAAVHARAAGGREGCLHWDPVWTKLVGRRLRVERQASSSSKGAVKNAGRIWVFYHSAWDITVCVCVWVTRERGRCCGGVEGKPGGRGGGAVKYLVGKPREEVLVS